MKYFFFFFLRIKSRFNEGKVTSILVENIKGFEINCSGIIANYVRVVNCLDQIGDGNFIGEIRLFR